MKKIEALLSEKMTSKNGQAQRILNLNGLEGKSLVSRGVGGMVQGKWVLVLAPHVLTTQPRASHSRSLNLISH